MDNDARDVSAAVAAAEEHEKSELSGTSDREMSLADLTMLEARQIPTKLFTNQSTVSMDGCPSREGAVCSGHGVCEARIETTMTVLQSGESVTDSVIKSWQCQCDGLFFGESCAHESFCQKTEADDVLSERNKVFVASVCGTMDGLKIEGGTKTQVRL